MNICTDGVKCMVFDIGNPEKIKKMNMQIGGFNVFQIDTFDGNGTTWAYIWFNN